MWKVNKDFDDGILNSVNFVFKIIYNIFNVNIFSVEKCSILEAMESFL